MAACFFAAVLALIFLSSFTHYAQTCTDQIARVGAAPMVHSCGPMSITDAPIVALLIGAVILLLPDVSSIEIPGVVRIENQIKEHEDRQEKRQAELVRLVQNVKVSQGQYMFIGPSEMAEILKRLPEKNQDFESDDT